MKILITTGIYPPSIGGPATYSKLLFDALPNRNIDVKILSFDEVRHLPKIIRHITYFIKAYVRSRDCDLIYAQDTVSVGFPSMLVSRLARKKFIVRVPGDYAWEQATQRFEVNDLIDIFQNERYSLKVEFLRKIQCSVVNHAQKVIVPSYYLKKIVSNWGINERKIQVIYNSVDVDETRGLFNKELIFSAGRLVPWKGFEKLIDGFHLISKEFPRLRLEIAGQGPDFDVIKKKIKEMHLEDRVFLLGKIEHNVLLDKLKESNIFILNTAYEGLSHQIIESMLCGVPVLTTAAGGNTELIKDHENGLIFEYNNAESIAASIKRFLLDPKLRPLFQSRYRDVRQLFSKERMIRELITALKI